MNFQQYVAGATEYHRDNSEQRYGQACFNFLFYCRPDIAEAVRGTNLDPFFKDDRVEEFLTFVMVKW